MIYTDGTPTIANDYPGKVIHTETREALKRVAELESQLRQRDVVIASLWRQLERVR